MVPRGGTGEFGEGNCRDGPLPQCCVAIDIDGRVAAPTLDYRTRRRRRTCTESGKVAVLELK